MIRWRNRILPPLLAAALLAGTAPAYGEEPDPGPDPAPEAASAGAADDLVPGIAGAADDLVPGIAGAADDLVPGIAGAGRPEWPMDTPDQVLPPTPPDAEVPVPEPAAEADELVEYVPRDATKAACTARAGMHQRRVERLLGLKADGKQSTADCEAIRAFQTRQKIKPAVGYAGPVTWARAELLAARKDLDPAGKCPVRSHPVVCVDLDRELMWVRKGKKITYAVVNIRSGRAGYRTRTGWHSVYWRHKDHWSTLYDTPMPFSQFFDGGQAFHGVYGAIATPTGSRGCVNLTYRNAERLWSVLRKGDRVYIWGKRPGL